MAKLYFRYGAMGSAKTLNLLAVRHNYEQQGKRVILLKPSIDVRFGDALIRSRAGLEYPADILVDAETTLNVDDFRDLSCVLVDECQFLSPYLVEQLRELTRTLKIPVIAYGLRTDFQAHLFQGSLRLMELADSIEEVKTTCYFCNRKAVFNLRHDSSGKAIVEGPSIMLGSDDHYSPACYECYQNRVQRTQDLQGLTPVFPFSDLHTSSDKA